MMSEIKKKIIIKLSKEQAAKRRHELEKDEQATKLKHDLETDDDNTQSQPQPESQPQPQPIIVNKGTGAGGANTNYYGKKFEDKTNNEQRLLENGYTKNSFTKNPKKACDYYLSKTYDDKTIDFVLQHGFKVYMKKKYNIELFRCPDEAYIIEYNNGRKVVKILEKKEQNVDGSVETTLWSGPSLKREYELVLGPNFEVFYGFCVSKFLKNKLDSNEKKYATLNTIFIETNIAVLFGDDENYFETFDSWFNNSL